MWVVVDFTVDPPQIYGPFTGEEEALSYADEDLGTVGVWEVAQLIPVERKEAEWIPKLIQGGVWK